MEDAVEGTKVLLVEDRETIVSTLQKIFTLAGYDCRSYISAEEFYTREDPEWSPDFALIDVILPGMDGLEFAVRLRDLDRNLKVALFSGDPKATLILERAEKTGQQFHILAKPVHPSELLELASKATPKNLPLAGGAPNSIIWPDVGPNVFL